MKKGPRTRASRADFFFTIFYKYKNINTFI